MPRKQFARQAVHFVKHVVPAAVKPVHSLWHEVIGFLFSTIAVWCTWKLWRNAASQAPIMMVLEVIFIAVMAGYGISSFLKARRISRS
jgi:heme A synthase